MKKILLIVVMFLIIPTGVFAKTYEVENSGFKITFDEQIWDVFASGEPFDAELLKKYDWDNETMQSYLKYYYMYIAAVYDGEELFDFSARTSPERVDYEVTNYEAFGSSVAREMGTDDYEIYENNYKFVKLEYYDLNDNQYFISYHILINSQYYMFTAQKVSEFTEDEKLEIKEVIDSIVFHENLIESPKFQINWTSAICSGITCMIGATIMYLALRKKTKNDK